jgi:phosphatidylglycerol:prolipoprotein diacylglycerol transferase
MFGPFGVRLGPLTLSYFGLILIAAMIVGGAVSYRRARARGQDSELVIDLLTWGLIGAVILARLFYIWNPPPSVAVLYSRRWFLTHPFDLQIGPLAIWSGGFGSAGALLGGLLGVFLLLRRKNADVKLWADILVPGALAGLAIAGLASVVNQQMYGPPTTLPWGVSVLSPVPPYDDPGLFPEGTRFHPTPAYLSVWALVTLGVVLWAESRRGLKPGDLFVLAGLILLPGLFLADFLRVDLSRSLFGLSGVQVVAILLLAGIVGLGVRRNQQAAAASEARHAAPAERSATGDE